MNYEGLSYIPITGEVLRDGTVDLDGKWFAECRYEGCELIFRGEAPFGHAGTKFERCRIRLEGRARMTLSVLGRFLTTDAVVGLIDQLVAERPPLN